MQIYYMKKEKVPIPVSTVILMIVTITYKFVLVAVGIGIAVFWTGISPQISGRDTAGILSWSGTKYFLCDIYDGPCFSSSSCQDIFGKRAEYPGKNASSPQKRRTT